MKITPIKREILLCLDKCRDKLCVSNIARKINRTDGITCLSVKELDNEGLIIYEKTIKDRKKRIPILTPLGKKVVIAIYNLYRVWENAKKEEGVGE